MSINYVDKIEKLVNAPRRWEQPSTADWNTVEAALGVSLPSDYKELVSRLGEGEFGCGFFLRNPVSTSEYNRLSREGLILHRTLIADLEIKLNLPLFPSANGFVLVASCDRQEFLVRNTAKAPNLEPSLIWLDVDTEEARPMSFGLPQFIHDLYLGLIDEPWATVLRKYFWKDMREPFFRSRPGLQP